METLFGFVQVRPVDAGRVFAGVQLNAPSEFQRRLADSETTDAPRATALAAARDFLASPSAVTTPDDITAGALLVDAIVTLGARAEPSVDDVVAHLTQRLGNMMQLIRSPAFVRDVTRVRDSLIATYLTGQPVALLQSMARGVALAELVGRRTLTDGEVDAVLRGPIELPGFMETLRSAAPAPPPADDRVARAEQLVHEVEQLQARSAELTRALSEIALVQPDEQLLVAGESAGPFIDALASQATIAPPRDAPRPAPDLRGAFGSTVLSRASVQQNILMSPSAVASMPEATVRMLRSLNVAPDTTPIRQLQLVVGDAALDFKKQAFGKVSEIYAPGPTVPGLARRLRLHRSTTRFRRMVPGHPPSRSSPTPTARPSQSGSPTSSS